MIKDTNVFDYEVNTSINAVIEVQNGTNKEEANLIINIEDQDIFLESLSTSKTKYELADKGNWIEVTKEEYEKLEKAKDINESGINSYQFPNTLDSGLDWSTTLRTNCAYGDSVKKIPANNYLFGFRYLYTKNFTQPFIKVKTSSTDYKSDFNDFGNKFPDHSGMGIHYFIYKGDRIPTTEETFLGVSCQIIGYAYPVVEGFNIQYENGDASTLPYGSLKGMIFYQGLSTGKVQW